MQNKTKMKLIKNYNSKSIILTINCNSYKKKMKNIINNYLILITKLKPNKMNLIYKKEKCLTYKLKKEKKLLILIKKLRKYKKIINMR